MAAAEKTGLGVEMKEGKTSAAHDFSDLQLAEAVRNYVPNTQEEKKLVRKVDIFLMPMLWIMYILNYVDRTNIVSFSHLYRRQVGAQKF